jgi:hypothetical protein
VQKDRERGSEQLVAWVSQQIARACLGIDHLGGSTHGARANRRLIVVEADFVSGKAQVG